MVISSVFIVVERNKSSETFSDVSFNRQSVEMAQSKSIPEPEADLSQENVTPLEKKEVSKDETREATEISEEAASAERRKIEIPVKSELVAGTNETESVLKVPEDKSVAGINTKEMQEKPDSAVSVMNEAISVGYVAVKSSRAAAPGAAEKDDRTQTGYSPPQPIDGNESFDKYIEDNLRNPAALTEGEKAEVVISFRIRSSGVIDSVNVILSPGKEFSDEAIRLIKEGPPWKPAMNNGEIIDDKVRIRIVFQ
jgi:TonB family protein